jgi:hypothetical protein
MDAFAIQVFGSTVHSKPRAAVNPYPAAFIDQLVSFNDPLRLDVALKSHIRQFVHLN